MVHPPSVHPHRRIFCNRTLNLRAVKAIGYDLDYTLVHYNVRAWEERAYEHARRQLLALGWPVADLVFDPGLVMRGLVIDTELGNLVKVDRFGFVKAALHGTERLTWPQTRKAYARLLVDLSDPRYDFANTLFSLSEACLFTQLVPRLDRGELEAGTSYRGLYRKVREAMGRAHVEGELKREILADPDAYVELDPDVPRALLDQKEAGKKLLVITNSDWDYARAMLAYAFDRFLPSGTTWRDLFDLTVVAARKPLFFTEKGPLLRVVDEEGRLQPVSGREPTNGVYFGGHAALVEERLGLGGESILYVGDHVYTDVNVSKKVQRWRTALVLRELERELRSIEADADQHRLVGELMAEKMRLEDEQNAARLALQRGSPEPAALRASVEAAGAAIAALDARVSPLLAIDGCHFSRVWGSLLRAGNDKSHLTRQIERHADIYTSRVSNFLGYTPFACFRAMRGPMPHDDATTVSYNPRQKEGG